MYILAAKFKDVEGVQYFVARSRSSLKSIQRDAADYRLWNDGWIDSKNADSWKTIGTHVVGELARIVF